MSNNYGVIPYSTEDTYLSLMEHVLHEGVSSNDRTDTGTLSIFNAMLKYDLSGGKLPLVTTKAVNLMPVVTETDWFLKGSTDTLRLNRLGTRIWDLWAEPSHLHHPSHIGDKESLTRIRKERLDGLKKVSFFQDTDSLVAEWKKKSAEIRDKLEGLQVPVPVVVMWMEYVEHTYYNYMVSRGWSNVNAPSESLMLAKYGVLGLMHDLLDDPTPIINVLMKEPDRIRCILPYKGGEWIGSDDFIYFTGPIPKYMHYNATSDYKAFKVIPKSGGGQSFIYMHHDKDKDVELQEYVWAVKRAFKEDSTARGIHVHVDIVSSDEYIVRPPQTTGHLGPIYGDQWRNLAGNDQIANLIQGLQQDPRSRRHLVSAWNPSMLEDMRLPPCHVMMQFYAQPLNVIEQKAAAIWWNNHVVDPERPHHTPRYKLSLKFYMRSSDLAIGLPFNLMNYSLILCKIASTCGYQVGDVIYDAGDVHVYSNHRSQVAEQLGRTPHPPASYVIHANHRWLSSPGHDKHNDIPFVDVRGYKHDAAIYMPVAK